MQRLSLLLALILALLAVDATAKKKSKKKEPPKPDTAEIDKAIAGLKSPGPSEVLESIHALAGLGAKQAVDPLLALLEKGPRNDITTAILQSLGSIGDERAVDTLIKYLNHRRPDARVAAIYALESFTSTQVTRALDSMLSDSDKEVRATAALALGKSGDAESVQVLFKAFERGVYDAAISIGQLGTPADAEHLAQFLGKADIKVLLPGFDEFLRRADFPEKAKLQILDRLFELAGPEVRRFALAYKASFPPETDPDTNELYKKVSRMVRQIQGD